MDATTFTVITYGLLTLVGILYLLLLRTFLTDKEYTKRDTE